MPFALPKIGIDTRKISFIGVMTALCISSNYLMIFLTNIKFMDLFVFISGYTMGIFPGVSVGILTWLVYGTLNPYGSNLPTLIATCMGESLYGLLGGVYAKLSPSVSPTSLPSVRATIARADFWVSNLKLGVIGFLLTFIYDLFTNVVTSEVFEIPLVPYLVMGMPFAVAHEVSNFIFFFFAGNALIGAIQMLTFRGGET